MNIIVIYTFNIYINVLDVQFNPNVQEFRKKSTEEWEFMTIIMKLR